ncbi:hypothetical protein Nepgr_004637 [Nepenthes gracilis]|uniref:NPK1-activating kinesin-like protein C-terminal domain-containing protein n=1 Tax=Nepenthes gracilis TaxID=150966 RepID=A0AAD3S1P3_NEPGR|nr:hypothetical protein Nepgr_004637 [Nepenthes gracilis]
MDGSQSSVGTNITDDLKSQSSKKIADEDIPSVTTFVAGLEDAKLQYEKQLEDGQVWETGAEPDELRKTFRDGALDPKLGTQETTDWPQQFEMLRRSIIELWQTCNVSLVHRTYFFLLFKGDPTDSIYLEVELRRLSFLKGTFSLGNQAVEGGQAKTLASSVKALRREREMLSKLINRRFCVEERKRLYQKWGIELESKRRRLQLVCRLWTDPKDLIHIAESAAVVAKLVEFSEQGRALKEMFGLSFTPPIPMTRRSHSWK